MLTVWDDAWDIQFIHPVISTSDKIGNCPSHLLVLLCLSKVLEDATNNNSQITLWTKNIPHMCSHFGSLCKIGRGTFESFPSKFCSWNPAHRMGTEWFIMTRWWFQFFVIFNPSWGRFQIWPIFFQKGWFNHQPDDYWLVRIFFWMNFGPKLSPFFEIQCLALCQVLPSVGRPGTYHMNGFLHLKRIETSNDCSKNWEDVNIQIIINKTCIYSNRIHFRMMFFFLV